MKKTVFFLPLLAAMTFTSCSSDEPALDNKFDETYDGQAYMKVRIAMPDNASSRAAGDFENGTAEEQAIKEIGLKFYNADGSFYGYGLPVKNATVTPQNPSGENVEGKVAEAVIVLQINSNSPKPTQVVAYANCGDAWRLTPEPNISEMDQIKNEITTAYDGTEYYTMTSSNYMAVSEGAASYLQGYQTVINPNSFKPTETEAKAEGVPVDIYVERLAAKVKVTKDADMTPTTITNGEYTLDFTIDGYALGGTNNQSYYIKHLNRDWTKDNLWLGWNDLANHRCYWAKDMNYLNKLGEAPALDYVSYNEVREKLTGSNDKWLYTAENTLVSPEKLSSTGTEDASRADASTVLNRYLYQTFAYVIGHYTIKKNGTVLTDAECPYLYEYAGRLFTAAEMMTHMQQTIGSVLFSQTNDGTKFIYTTIDLVKEGLVEIGSYANDASLVCLKLTAKATDAELSKYYLKDGESYRKVTSADDVTPLLKQSETQAYGFKYDNNVANSGNGGYLAYFPVLIKHLNCGEGTTESTLGYYGVVRNHCYTVTINSIKGLGIGIFDPDVDIIPKDKIKPLYLAATFNVLSWRVVGQTVDL